LDHKRQPRAREFGRCVAARSVAAQLIAAAIIAAASRGTALAQLPSPPTQITTHSAFVEDAKPGVARLYNLASSREPIAPPPKPIPRATIIAETKDVFAPPVVTLPPGAALGGLGTTSAKPQPSPPLSNAQLSNTTISSAPAASVPAQNASTGARSTPGLFASSTNVAMVPPSAAQRDYVPNPPYATSPLGEGAMPTMPPEDVPFFSLRPSFIPEGAKSGAFQQSISRATYLPRMGDDGFGMTSLAKQFTFALPPFISGSPILLTPSFTTHFLDGPGQIDVPPQLFDGELEFRYMKQATPRLGIDLAVAPSFFSDGDNTSSEAWRVTGRALGAWSVNDRWQIVGGGVYTGRSDFPAVPVAGFIWKPNCNVRVEALFPRPRAYYRPFVNGTVEHWFYLGGEYGGNTWAIDHAGGIPDKMTYADLRLLVGWERKSPGGLNGRLELGWVFDRSIEFTSGRSGFDPDDTLMVRGEFSF
jgi:hypothetical protein